MNRLKVGLMGLEGVGSEYLAAIRSDDQFDLVAVADANPELLRRSGDVHPLRTYEDYRSMIVETARSGLDVLFVALEPFQSNEFVEMAAASGVGVFHKAPFARTVREAQHLVHRFAQHDRPLVVSRFWQFDPAFACLGALKEPGHQVYAAIAEVRTTDTPTGPRGDSARAGGGVLLNGAYDVVDMVVSLLGLPAAVYARCGLAAGPHSGRAYDTEDVALVSMSFGNGQIASVTAVRGMAESSWRVTFPNTEQTTEACPEKVTVTPNDGGPPRHHRMWARHPVSGAISAFVESWNSEDQRFASTAAEHVATIAAIEAAYLSAKTGEPESPARLLG